MGRIVKKSDIADIFGCSLPTVDAWVRDGCPVKTTGGKGVAYQLDTYEVHRWLLGREKRPGRPGKPVEPAKSIDPETGEERISIEEANRRKAVADAKKSELDLAQRMERVAPVDMIAKVVSDEIANARTRLLGIPTKLRPTAQICSGDEEKSKKIVTTVEDLIREALEEIKSFGDESV